MDEILKILEQVVDYAISMKIVTRYTCSDEPNFTYICHKIGEYKAIQKEQQTWEKKGENKINE